MSFVPPPQRQNANSQNAVTPTTTTAGAPAPAAAVVVDEGELIFNIRTFDLFFIDRQSLMYRDGYAKVSPFSAGVRVCGGVFFIASSHHCSLSLLYP